jgi:hypothetical protein
MQNLLLEYLLWREGRTTPGRGQAVEDLQHAQIAGLVQGLDGGGAALAHAHEPQVGEAVDGLSGDDARGGELLGENALRG